MDSATSATDSGSNSQRPQLTTTNVRRRRRRQRRPRGSSATRQPDQGPSVASGELEQNQQTQQQQQQQHEHITTTIGNPTDTTARESNSITCSSTTTKHEQKQMSPDKAELLVSEQTSPETSNSENSNQLEKVDLNLVSPQAPSLSSAIQRGRRNHQDPPSGLRTPPSAPRPRVAPARRTRSANRPPPEPTRLATSRGRLSTSSVVRVLFRDQQEQQQQHPQEQQQRQNVIRGQSVSHTSSIGLTVRPVNQSASIVEANRRLVERQIEAIQMADSTRWNFDFRNCRPMHLAGHRYVHCSVIDSTDADDNNNNNDNINNNNNINHDDNTNNNSTNTTTQRNCRPLNDQNQGQNSS